MLNIGFVGLGKLGLDCAEVFAKSYKVFGYDIYPRNSSVIEVCSAEETIKNSDWIFIAVPTPHVDGYDGSVPSSHMEPRDFGHDAVIDAVKKINEYADSPKKVVLISTVLPGTTRENFVRLLAPQHQFLYNPYLIAMGSVKWDMVNPEMVIIGTQDGDRTTLAQELIDLYQPLMENDPRYVVGTWEEAESIKIFYNTFISAKIGMVNMIQDFAMNIGHINVDVVTDALANSTMRIMGPKYMTAGMGDAGACHPRDNIALRWLAKKYDIGYDLFDTIMLARERQAENLARFLIRQSINNNHMPIYIHGKAYKPDVPYCIGSYSTLVGHYLEKKNHRVRYIDPMADDRTDCHDNINEPSVILLAHNRRVTYGYTGLAIDDGFYCEIPAGSVVVDPWRQVTNTERYKVLHYGNTRISQF